MVSGALLRPQEVIVALRHNTGTTWTVVQGVLAGCPTSTGAGTKPCTVTVASTTPGNLLIFLDAFEYGSLGANTYSSSAPTGEGTWTHCTGCENYYSGAGTSWMATEAWYILSATGGSTSLTFNLVNAPCAGCAGYQDAVVIEVHRATGTAVLDTQAIIAGVLSSTACNGPTLTLTGTNDYIVQWAAMGEVPSALASPFTAPSLLDASDVEGVFGGAINQTSGAAVLYSQSPAGSCTMAALAFK